MAGVLVQADATARQPGKSQALSRCAYVDDNLLRYVDPTGHFTEDELRRWGVPQWQIDAWKEDAGWWQTIRMALLGDKLSGKYRDFSGTKSAIFKLVTDNDQSGAAAMLLELVEEDEARAGWHSLELFHMGTLASRRLYRKDAGGAFQDITPDQLMKPRPGLYFRPDRLDAQTIQGDLVNLGVAAVTGYDPALVGPGVHDFAGLWSGFLSEKQAADPMGNSDRAHRVLGVAGLVPGWAIPVAVVTLLVDASKAFELVPAD